MEILLYLNLAPDYMLEKSEYIAGCSNLADAPGENVVVISDDWNAAVKWAEFAVIGVEHAGQIKGVSYVTDSVENVDEDFARLAYCRRFKLPMTVCVTDNLVIREMTLDDVPQICKMYEDTENVRFVPPVKSFDEEVAFADAYIENMYGIYGYGLWVVVFKETGEIIGRAGIEHREIDGEICHEIGYLIKREYQGCGLATEAVEAVLAFAHEYGIEELFAYINEKNTPSIKLAEGLGARKVKEIHDGVNKFILFRF